MSRSSYDRCVRLSQRHRPAPVLIALFPAPTQVPDHLLSRGTGGLRVGSVLDGSLTDPFGCRVRSGRQLYQVGAYSLLSPPEAGPSAYPLRRTHRVRLQGDHRRRHHLDRGPGKGHGGAHHPAQGARAYLPLCRSLCSGLTFLRRRGRRRPLRRRPAGQAPRPRDHHPPLPDHADDRMRHDGHDCRRACAGPADTVRGCRVQVQVWV